MTNDIQGVSGISMSPEMAVGTYFHTQYGFKKTAWVLHTMVKTHGHYFQVRTSVLSDSKMQSQENIPVF